MNKAKSSFYLIAFFLFSLPFYSQGPEKIKVRKFESEFYFFQKGEVQDTVSSNNHDLFYMKVSKNSGCATRIEIENGRLVKEGNDTTYRLSYFPNLNYLHTFNDSISVSESKFQTKKSVQKCKSFKTLINGSNTSPDPRVIVIRFIDTNHERVFLKNRFYYKSGLR